MLITMVFYLRWDERKTTHKLTRLCHRLREQKFHAVLTKLEMFTKGPLWVNEPRINPKRIFIHVEFSGFAEPDRRCSCPIQPRSRCVFAWQACDLWQACQISMALRMMILSSAVICLLLLLIYRGFK